MPIYEYLCESCGMVNEKLQKLTDPPPGRCEECGSKKLAKLVSRSAFQLKGGGWYSDLYASKKAEAPPKEGAEAAPASKPAAEATAGTAPEKKGEATPSAPAPAPAKEPVKASAPDRPAAKGRRKAG